MNKRLVTYLSVFCFTAATLPLRADEPSAFIASYDRMPVANIEVTPEQLPPNASFEGTAVLNKLKTKIGDPFSQSICGSLA